MRRLLTAGALPLAALMLQVTPALACGGLVAPDGDVHLDRATTFVAWHDGLEHYVTSFAFSGSAADVGWIVPLPAVPDNIQPAGRWTLQRLEAAFAPPLPQGVMADAAGADGSIVVQQVQVEALDITVLQGSGQAVIDWCTHNGFALPTETREHLLRYAQGSPVFMAARYDSTVAGERGMRAGDGVPLLVTMHTAQLWVPLEVLANDDETVDADIFLLTDQQLQPARPVPAFTLPPFSIGSTNSVDGADGFTMAGSKQLEGRLHSDLASDRNMGWMPQTGWLTYLRLRAPSESVTYDLGVGRDSLIRLASFGTSPARMLSDRAPSPGGGWIIGAAAGCGLALVLAGLAVLLRRRHRSAAPYAP